MAKEFLLYLESFFDKSRLKIVVFYYISLLTLLPPLQFSILNYQKTGKDRAKILSPLFFIVFFSHKNKHCRKKNFNHIAQNRKMSFLGPKPEKRKTLKVINSLIFCPIRPNNSSN